MVFNPNQPVDLLHPLAAIEAQVATTNNLLQNILTKMGGQQILGPSYSGLPFSSINVDLTVANNNLMVRMQNPANFLQFWCDGGFDGISIGLGSSGAQNVNLNQLTTIPMNGQNFDALYVTSDVRQGRSALTIYFIKQSTPFDLTLGAAGITQDELAARLGSIDTFDRRGQIMFYEDFEQGIKSNWTQSLTAGSTARGGKIYPTSAWSRSGLLSACLINGTNVGDTSEIWHYEPHVGHGRYGLEFSFAGPGDDFRANLNMIDNGNLLSGVRLLKSPGNPWYAVYILTGNLTWTLISGVGAYIGSFSTAKLVVDFATKTYVRLIIGYQTMDLSRYPIYIPQVTNAAPQIGIVFDEIDVQGTNYGTFIDDVILTKNEP